MNYYISIILKLVIIISIFLYMLYSIYDIDFSNTSVDFNEDDVDVDNKFRFLRQYNLLKKLYNSNKVELNPRKKILNYVIISIFLSIIVYVVPNNSMLDFTLIFYTLFSYIIYRLNKDKTDNIIIKYIIPIYIIIMGCYSSYKFIIKN